MVGFIILTIGCFYVFFGKAVSDISDNYTVWKTSIFSKHPKDSFFGSKEYSYVRKDHDNFILNYLFHTILVFITDIWHFGNFIRRIGIYMSIIGGILIGSIIPVTLFNISLIIGGFIFINIVGFHVFYSFILRSTKESYEDLYL